METDRAASGEIPERTIGQLVADATHDVQGIIASTRALAQAEVRQGIKGLGKGGGMFAGAALFGLLGLVFLLHNTALWIGSLLGADTWGYLVVAVVLLVVAAVLALVGKKAMDKGGSPVPTKAIAEAKQTIATIKR